ncbi:trypsin-like [Daphnia pulex]|uniref:trypsin-like n=1 Tax=Daphnia pulex TaxID=6669 RepID=UPI001EDE352B|nr:trypsin-like [Daphnia pulex]
MKMRMSRLPHLAIFFFAASVHLLLFSICPVSSRIYRTNDAVVIEVDDVRPSTFANRNFANPAPIPMMYAVNPYTILLSQPYSNFPFWPYPLYQQPASSSVPDVEDVAATSSESKQQKINCGVGPPSPPQRSLPVAAIVGGSEAIPNSWPFIAGLRIAGRSSVFCGGSIISPTRILTAAHCVEKMSAFNISTMTVNLGMHNQTGNDADHTRRVSRVVYHIAYNANTNQNDVAVLTIDPPIVYSAAVSPVCLPRASSAVDQFAGKDAAIMGWGRENENDTIPPDVLKQATVQIIPNADCKTQYAVGGVEMEITNQQLCASADGRDTCQGDSGGPIVVQAGSTTAWTQVGITSFGNGCAKPNFAGVYASVAFFRNWINTYMNS